MLDLIDQMTSSHPPAELYTSGIGNSYFFTGRRLHFVENLSEADENPNRQVQYSRNRHYQPGHGRWLQRDPAEYVDGANLYEYAVSRPTLLSDPEGRWGKDVHYGLTLIWTRNAGMKHNAAKQVAAADDAIDEGDTGPMPWQDQRRHFNRSMIAGEDSRLVWADDGMARAEELCTDVACLPVLAAWKVGGGLHSIQDWWAHGEYSEGNANTWNPHGAGYDDWGMDATHQNGTPLKDGRPRKYHRWAGWHGWQEDDWPWWVSGSLRKTGTKRDSMDYVDEFLSWVRRSGCCDCKDYFLPEGATP